MNNNKYCIIMAGGVGSRFWPKSRQTMPKQFLDILGTGKTMLRQTYERYLPIIANENFRVMTNRRYRDIVLEQLPELRPEQVLCEPIARNTAPAVCYAAFSLLNITPEAEMIITPADNYIDNEEQFREMILDSTKFAAENNTLMTVGIKPTRPETGYGYIQVSDKNPISRVKSFTEKPILELAQTFVECGEFFWNSGIFIWKASTIIEAFREHMPENYALFSSIMEVYGTEQEGAAISRIFSECRAISIDFGVLERADNVFVSVGEFGWSDIGTWGSLYLLSERDKYGNTGGERSLLSETRNCVISLPKDKVAVVEGLKDYIIVDTEDVLLICPRSDEHSIKNYIDEVKYREGDSFI